MDTPDDDFEPWTSAGAADIIAAGEALAAAIRTHAQTLAALTESRDDTKLFAANDALLPVVLAYADAQFNLTGNSFPFGPLHDFADDDEEEGEDADEPVVGSGLTVASRRDFVVTDEDAVIAAGRAAYAALWPDDPASAAADDVTYVGRALYQFAHLHGWDTLTEMNGLEPVGAATVVVGNDDLLRGDPDGWPEEPFAFEGPLLYSQLDVY